MIEEFAFDTSSQKFFLPFSGFSASLLFSIFPMLSKEEFWNRIKF